MVLKKLMQELIDTLWNVNLLPASFPGVHTSELIDTLWNVNETLIEIKVDFETN